MDENKDDEDFQEETIKEFLKPRICLERLRKYQFRWLENPFLDNKNNSIPLMIISVIF